MPLIRDRNNKALPNAEIVTMIKKNPERVYGVKASRLYAQIAKTGRNPLKRKERVALIEALNSSNESSNTIKTIRKGYRYVPMKGKDISLCFGKDIASLPGTSFCEISTSSES